MIIERLKGLRGNTGDLIDLNLQRVYSVIPGEGRCIQSRQFNGHSGRVRFIIQGNILDFIIKVLKEEHKNILDR